jgi:gamma-glutamyltranspeptidase/glutathione hydrolase
MNSRPELIGTHGAVSSTHWLASAIAMSILERGGNAFDAAVAAGFVLQVVEPHYNGIGGEVSIVLRTPDMDDAAVICGQGPMPAAASPSLFRSLGLTQIPGSGLLPACVPGAFGGWLRLLAEFGTMRLADVLDPAIGYAETGFPLLPRTAAVISLLAPLFATEWLTSGRTYMPDGKAPAAGSRVCNRLLAETYRRLLTEAEAASNSREGQIEAAQRAFYQGFVAEEIDKFLRSGPVLDGTGRHHRGLLTGDDLAAWQPATEKPVSYTYREKYRVFKPAPWSQGPVFLQQLALLNGFDIDAMGPVSADYIHLVTECAKLAFADRNAWYGDPAHTEVPIDALLSEEYTNARRALVEPTASPLDRPGTPGTRPPAPATYGKAVVPISPEDPFSELASGLPSVVLRATEQRGDTCTVSVVDKVGNIVAAVPSGGWLKSSPAIGNLGFPLGTRGQMMLLEEGHPNTVAPGRRPRSTLSPTVVVEDGARLLAFGTPGGDRQDQWCLQFFLAAAHFGLDLQAAIEIPAFCIDQVPNSFVPHESRPNVLVLENSQPQNVLADLTRRGHSLDVVPPMSLGQVCAVGADWHNKYLMAGASPRGRQAYAACW